jgi:alkylhydroperoxidase AhpD family core domain
MSTPHLLENTMNTRIEWAKHAPEAYKAMVGLEQALAKSGLENSLLELVRLRASQINGCAYCINMHANDARQAGETEARLQTLSVWQETAYFTPRERAALAWVENLTRLPERGAPQPEYEALQAHFEPQEVVNLTLAIATINAWNRFGVGFAMVPA